MGELLAIAALVMFSVNIIVTKAASSRLDLGFGFMVSIAVNVLFAGLLFMVSLPFRETPLQWHGRAFLFFLLAGLFSTFLGRWFFFKTIAMLGPSRASAFQVSNPLFTVMIAWVFLDETLRSFELIAIFMIMFGLFLVSYAGRETAGEASPEQAGGPPRLRSWMAPALNKGVLIALLSAVSYAVSNVLRGQGIRDWNEPVLGALIGAVLGMVLHMSFNYKIGNFLAQFKAADKKGLYLYMFSGMLTISAQTVSIASMWYIPVSIANLITLSTPVIVTPVSYFLLKNEEGITWRTLTGIALVLGGICLIVLF
jgi:drug/metabolite transporter (DMT)-like permease